MFKFRKQWSGKQIPNHHAKLMELLLFIPDLKGSFSPRKKICKSYDASQCHNPQGGGYCDEPCTCSNDSVRRNGGTAPSVNLGTRWRSVVICRFIRLPLPTRRKELQLTVEYRLGLYRNPSGRFGGKEKSVYPSGNRTKIRRLSNPQPSHYTIIVPAPVAWQQGCKPWFSDSSLIYWTWRQYDVRIHLKYNGCHLYRPL